jgi:hypothetical protein
MRRRFVFICFLGTAQLFAADPPPPAAGSAVAQESRTIAVHAKDVIPVNAQLRETTLIVLPQEEKVMTVYCGDKDNWVIDGTENFVTVKPAKSGAHTDIHILTDHANAYTLSFTEVPSVLLGSLMYRARFPMSSCSSNPRTTAVVSGYSASRCLWMRTSPSGTSRKPQQQSKMPKL